MSQAYHSHPEFGWLCPAPSLRRKVRVAVVLAFLVIAGALALKSGHSPSVDGTLTLAHGDGGRSKAETNQTDGQATVTATAERPRALDGGVSGCEQDPWRFIDGKCGAGKARRLPIPRAVNEGAPIASLPLGRSAPSMPALSAESAGLAGTAHAAAPQSAVSDEAPAADTLESKPTVADVARRHVPASKNARRLSRVRHDHYDFPRERSWAVDRWTASAYAFSNHRSRYERPVLGSW